MCEKQCRDENGFKCHMMSESHQRQLLLFGENPNSYLHDYSKQFEKVSPTSVNCCMEKTNSYLHDYSKQFDKVSPTSVSCCMEKTSS